MENPKADWKGPQPTESKDDAEARAEFFRERLKGIDGKERVQGAADLIPRRFVIEVDISAATSLLKHAAGFHHLVKGEIINILMLLSISPEVRIPSAWWSCAKLLIKHVFERRNRRSCAGVGCHGGRSGCW